MLFLNHTDAEDAEKGQEFTSYSYIMPKLLGDLFAIGKTEPQKTENTIIEK
ncbi:hypothetical protein [Floridanema evergladense]|uniref:Uncharacterized protein n=1 Tax=Floridaenema evergladense BLCC-F167 TaxID=3153639 RepID=A0ABV4WQW9_9CYAN